MKRKRPEITQLKNVYQAAQPMTESALEAVHEWASKVHIEAGNYLVFDEKGAPYVPFSANGQVFQIVDLTVASDMKEEQIRQNLEDIVMAGKLDFKQLSKPEGANQIAKKEMELNNMESKDNALEQTEAKPNVAAYRTVFDKMIKDNYQAYVSGILQLDGNAPLTEYGYRHFMKADSPLLNEAMYGEALSDEEAEYTANNTLVQKHSEDLKNGNYTKVLGEMLDADMDTFERAAVLTEGYKPSEEIEALPAIVIASDDLSAANTAGLRDEQRYRRRDREIE